MGSRYPKKTHARTGAKHLLDGRRPEDAITGVSLATPRIFMYVGGRKTTNIKRYHLSDIKRDERAKTDKKKSICVSLNRQINKSDKKHMIKKSSDALEVLGTLPLAE